MFDAYHPETTNLKNITNGMREKAKKQADRVVVIMDNTSVTPTQLQQYMSDNPNFVGSSLKEVIAIKGGQITNIYIK